MEIARVLSSMKNTIRCFIEHDGDDQKGFAAKVALRFSSKG